MKTYGGYSLLAVRSQLERGELLSSQTIRALLDAAEKQEQREELIQIQVRDATRIAEAFMRYAPATM